MLQYLKVVSSWSSRFNGGLVFFSGSPEQNRFHVVFLEQDQFLWFSSFAQFLWDLEWKVMCTQWKLSTSICFSRMLCFFGLFFFF